MTATETRAPFYLQRLAGYFEGRSYLSFPEEVRRKARRVLVDFLSELAVGYREGPLARVLNPWLIEQGGRPEATLLGEDVLLPAGNAALGMGVMGHAIELDDGHRWGTSHPAVAVCPAALAAGERDSAAFPEILGAIVTGYEVMLRAARAINPSHLRRGFHSTGTCGSLGAAAAAASIAGLDAERTAFAISFGGLQSAGLQEMLHDHPSSKPLQPGRSAQSGILAAELARRGAGSPRSLFEGEHGWLKAMSGSEYSESALVGELGERWEILQTYTKLYPTCRHCHATIDLAREAYRELQPTLEDIAGVTVWTYSLGAAEVGHIHCPQSYEQAMFSLPFSVALAFDRGNVTLSDYGEATLADPWLQAVAEKVEIRIDAEMDARYPEERGARIDVVLRDGRRFQKAIPVAKGEPENPVDDNELYNKLGAMLAHWYPPSFLAELWEQVVEAPPESTDYKEIVTLFGRYCRP
ncbi:MAG: MmgE/PrpD family protein [Synergistales bacterium]|nr:MmgE/PrpD family protein [Synergistales bacterium]